MKIDAEWGGLVLHPVRLKIGTFVSRCSTTFGLGWIYFAEPSETLKICRNDLLDLERVSLEGKHVALLLDYSGHELNSIDASALIGEAMVYDHPPTWFASIAPVPALPPLKWQKSWRKAEYESRFHFVKTALSQGETYQANLTFDYLATGEGVDLGELFASLLADPIPPYASLYRSDSRTILSLSPELFLERSGNTVMCKPMKGTGGGQLPELNSSKNRAENLMIVDMIRNDLGRICDAGKISVPELFAIEDYQYVGQMTSLVVGEAMTNLPGLLDALFPCASIVGAPKVRTMELLQKWEGRPRGAYTGALGLLAAGGEQRFSVLIRTIEDCQDGLRYGVGSGVTWDSELESEWAECLAKAEPISRRARGIGLIETMKVIPGESIWLLEYHQARLIGSARKFEINCDFGALWDDVLFAANQQHEACKLRLVLHADGRWDIAISALENADSVINATLATLPVNSASPFLRHKTTERTVYGSSLASPSQDILLWNERGEVTEFTAGNLIVRTGNRFITPPVECGCLPGCLRAALLETGDIEEEIVRLDAIGGADQLFRINSVRGRQQVRLAEVSK